MFFINYIFQNQKWHCIFSTTFSCNSLSFTNEEDSVVYFSVQSGCGIAHHVTSGKPHCAPTGG